MQDDLRFASEAIQQIANQAIKSIQQLYQNRHFPNTPATSYEPISTIDKAQESQKLEKLERQDPLSRVETRSVGSVTETPTSTHSRPQRIDEGLHNLDI